MVIHRDRIGRIELKTGPTGARATVFDTSGRRSAMSLIAAGSRIRNALAAGGALGLVDVP